MKITNEFLFSSSLITESLEAAQYDATILSVPYEPVYLKLYETVGRDGLTNNNPTTGLSSIGLGSVNRSESKSNLGQPNFTNGGYIKKAHSSASITTDPNMCNGSMYKYDGKLVGLL